MTTTEATMTHINPQTCTTPCDGTGYTGVTGVICTTHYVSPGDQPEDFGMCVNCGVRPWGFGYCGEECRQCGAESV